MKNRKGIYIAIIISLSLHAVVLIFLNFLHPNDQKTEEQISYEELIDMDFVEIIQESEDHLELNASSEQIKNLVANRESERSSQERSYNQQSEENLASDTYNDLKDFEREIQEQLNAEKADTESSDKEEQLVNEAVEKENYEYWDKSYDGKVTASFSLSGRTSKNLRIPAYLCQQSGQVSIAITVNPEGVVIQVQVNESGTNTQSECLREESLKYALKSTFNSKLSAPKKQQGTITYIFIAQ